MKEEKVIEKGEEYIIQNYKDGTKYWYNNKGQYHRLGGLPACEYVNGNKSYYENGKLHRLNGPAYEGLNGYKSYYFFGKEYTEKEYYEIINNKEKLQNLINMQIIKEII